VSINILLNDSDIDGSIDSNSTLVVTQALHGSVVINAGIVNYVPNANYFGNDSFIYTVKDNQGLISNIATVSLVITPVNDAPVAVDDNVSTDEDTQIVIDALINDSDIDGTIDKQTLTLVNAPTLGDVSVDPLSGRFVYTPRSNLFGIDSFTYTVRDNDGLISNIATVTILINSVNDAPLAQEQNLTLLEDTNISMQLTGIDVDGDSLVYRVSTQPSNGTLTGTAPNLVYTPVTPVNDAPVTQDKHFVIPEDTNVSVLLTASDVDGDALSYRTTVQPTHGMLSGTGSQRIYIPNSGYYGTDSFSYVANDGSVDSNEAVVSIEIVRINQAAPIAIDQNVTTDEDVPVSIILQGVDSDNDTLDYSIISQPTHGSLSGVGKNITYTPDGNYSGSDSFTFRVNDGLLDSNEAVVNIEVIPKPDLGCTDSNIAVGNLNPVLKFQWNWRNASYPRYKQVMSAPMVGQLTDDNGDGKIDKNDIPDIVFTTFSGYNYHNDGVLRAISGDDGHEILAIRNVTPYPAPTLGDIDNDGLLEIIIGINNRGGLKVFENDGTLKWSKTTSFSGSPTLADLNNDGNVEIIFSDSVYDKLGNKLWTYDRSFLPLIANINDDVSLEIIANGKAYNSDGTILWDSGYTNYDFGAIGNFDNDKYPEIVLRSGGKIILLEHDGTLKWGPVSIPGGGGGAITVSDLDGDGKPEIGIAGARYYVVFEDDGSIKWQSKTQDYSSQSTGSTVFDFEGDGRAEILYSDELNFRIYDGSTGDILYKLANPSGTLFEYPVVADIDNDGHAEIILVSNNYYFSGVTGIRVLEDANNTWMPTRSIWNQHSYHISNINDDGTIPRYEEPSWLTHNTYRLNTFAVNTRCQKPPKAYGADYTTLEDTAKSIALLAKDINNDTLTYTITKQPTNGTLTGTAPYLTYIPDAGYIGIDGFSYLVNDGIVDSNEANISIAVLSSNNALVAVDDTVSFDEDTNISVDVLANDSNATGSTSIAIVVSPLHGDASIINGKIFYLPKNNYNGQDTLYYTYRDSNGLQKNKTSLPLKIHRL